MPHDNSFIIAYSVIGFIALSIFHLLAGYAYLQLALTASRKELAGWQFALGYALAVFLKYFTPAITLATGVLLYVILVHDAWPAPGAALVASLWMAIHAFQGHISYRFPLEGVARLFDRTLDFLIGAPLDRTAAGDRDPQ